MHVSYENRNGKLITTGKQYKLEFDDFLVVNKMIYKPTKKKFLEFCNVLKQKPFFDKYNFLVIGGFANFLNNKTLSWRTWDVDMAVYDNSKKKNYKEIQTVLKECLRIAICDFDFFLDMAYYPDGPNTKYHTSNYRNEITLDNYKDFIRKNKKEGWVVFKTMKRDGKFLNNNSDLTEIDKGLYKKITYYPQRKQVLRELIGLRYSPPINLKEYLENIK